MSIAEYMLSTTIIACIVCIASIRQLYFGMYPALVINNVAVNKIDLVRSNVSIFNGKDNASHQRLYIRALNSNPLK